MASDSPRPAKIGPRAFNRLRLALERWLACSHEKKLLFQGGYFDRHICRMCGNVVEISDLPEDHPTRVEYVAHQDEQRSLSIATLRKAQSLIRALLNADQFDPEFTTEFRYSKVFDAIEHHSSSGSVEILASNLNRDAIPIFLLSFDALNMLCRLFAEESDDLYERMGKTEREGRPLTRFMYGYAVDAAAKIVDCYNNIAEDFDDEDD